MPGGSKVDTDSHHAHELRRKIQAVHLNGRKHGYSRTHNLAISQLGKAVTDRQTMADESLENRIIRLQALTSGRARRRHRFILKGKLRVLEAERKRRRDLEMEAAPNTKKLVFGNRQTFLTSNLGLTTQAPQDNDLNNDDTFIKNDHLGSGLQLHLAPVSGKHRKMIPGFIKSSGGGNKKEPKDAPTLALKEPFHEQYGRQALAKVLKRKSITNQHFASAWRQSGTRYDRKRGGTGQDETLRTSTAREMLKDLIKKGDMSTESLNEMAALLSRSRTETSQLAWPTGDPSTPIGGHPGSLSKNPKRMNQGLTAQHGTRDIDRAKAAEHQYQQSLEKTNKPIDAAQDAITMSELHTIQNFSAPYSVLNKIDFSQADENSKNVYSARYGTLVENRMKTADFDSFAKGVHGTRERRKWETALTLMRAGRSNLVSPAHQKFLQETHGNVLAAMNQHQFDLGKVGNPPESKALALPKHSSNDQMLTLDEMQSKLAKASDDDPRPISPPRHPPPAKFWGFGMKKLNLKQTQLPFKSVSSSSSNANDHPMMNEQKDDE